MAAHETIKRELASLAAEGTDIFLQEVNNSNPKLLKDQKVLEKAGKGPINQRYQNWYSRCIGLFRSLMPERLHEFVGCYEPDPKRKETDWLSYTIKDYLMGMVVTRGYDRQKVFEPFGSFSAKMQHQITMMEALLETVDTRIANVEGVLEADLFRDELDTAFELASRGHLRAAGAVAGVVLESHLKHFSRNKGLKVTKKAPTIADLNEALKSAGIVDTPTWRRIQLLGDIRNLCVHSKERDPTKEEIQDLMVGVQKYIAELN
jgi:hypothetical protein